MNPIPVGVDIGKNVFQIHYIALNGGEVVNKSLKRANFLEYFANLAPCMIGMEACGGSQHWARSLSKCRSSQSMLAVPKGVLAMFTNTASVVFCSA